MAKEWRTRTATFFLFMLLTFLMCAIFNSDIVTLTIIIGTTGNGCKY